jgi:hypothetical protein
LFGLRVVSLLRFSFFILLALAPQQVRANTSDPLDEAGKLLPGKVGDFRAAAAVYPPQSSFLDAILRGRKVIAAAARDYVSIGGDKLGVVLVTTSSDSSAYALLTRVTVGEYEFPVLIQRDGLGTASVSKGSLFFIKGSTFVIVSGSAPPATNEAQKALASSLADTLDKGEGDIPVLVKHLPDWQHAQESAIYAVTSEGLTNIMGNEPALEAIDFAGGAEAVRADYGSARMLIVEFTTPQLAGDNDRRIVAKIQELWKQGQPAPTAYRRVGNYSVFVFHAPDEKTANQLIDQVKYQQVVQWLGENPNWLERAQRNYTETLLGTFIAVIKASGLAAALCLGIGGFFGALLFARRRARQKTVGSYSDAGGMTRLNLDEMTVETNATRLVGPGLSDKVI